MRERIRLSLGDLQRAHVLDHAHRSVVVVLGDFSRRRDRVGGLGKEEGKRRSGEQESQVVEGGLICV